MKVVKQFLKSGEILPSSSFRGGVPVSHKQCRKQTQAAKRSMQMGRGKL